MTGAQMYLDEGPGSGPGQWWSWVLDSEVGEDERVGGLGRDRNRLQYSQADWLASAPVELLILTKKG